MTQMKICVIENDADIRETLAFLFTEEGYEVIEAPNNAEGKALLEASPEPLVVLLDDSLLPPSGPAVLDMVAQEDGLRARHTFLVMSTLPEKTIDDSKALLNALGVPIIPKPFDIDALLGAVRRAEQQHQRTA